MNSYLRKTGAPLSLRKWQGAMSVIAVISGSLIGAIEVCGQTPQYTVTELPNDDAPGYHVSSTTLGISLVGPAAASTEN
jgi:hypothetical protein